MPINLASLIRDVPDFPKPGILFKDISPLLGDATAFRQSINRLSDLARGYEAQAIVAIESRGFIFGAAVAVELGVPFIPVRKQGKLPFRTLAIQYSLEYGYGTLEIHADALHPGTRAVIIDDVLATGGTAKGTANLITKSGAIPVAFLGLMEIGALNGRTQIPEIPVEALISY